MVMVVDGGGGNDERVMYDGDGNYGMCDGIGGGEVIVMVQG